MLASSMVVYGSVVGRPGGRAWRVVDEDSPLAPADFYGPTKVIAEQVAGSFATLHDISTTALRLGMFLPETFERYGFRLRFAAFLDAWRRGDVGHYPFADKPWWGAERST